MRVTILCCWAALTAATDVTFEPGPGLKKNEDGTYSRTYDAQAEGAAADANATACLLYTSPSPRDRQKSRMPSSA